MTYDHMGKAFLFNVDEYNNMIKARTVGNVSTKIRRYLYNNVYPLIHAKKGEQVPKNSKGCRFYTGEAGRATLF